MPLHGVEKMTQQTLLESPLFPNGNGVCRKTDDWVCRTLRTKHSRKASQNADNADKAAPIEVWVLPFPGALN